MYARIFQKPLPAKGRKEGREKRKEAKREKFGLPLALAFHSFLFPFSSFLLYTCSILGV
jgi:hypothetical protein